MSRLGAAVRGAAMFAALLTGCRDAPSASDPRAPAPTPDAGSATLQIRRPELGVAFSLPASWTREAAPSGPGAGGVTTVVVARRRRSVEDPGSVPPRVELTVEPAGPGPAELVFARVLSELKRIGDRPGVTVERAGFAARRLGATETAEIRLRYRVGGPNVRVHQSVLLLLREGPPRTLVTLTSSHVDDRDGEVESELERMFERVEIFEPESPDGDRP